MSISKLLNNNLSELNDGTNKLPIEDIFPVKTLKKGLDKEIASFLYKSRNRGKTRDQICKEVNAARSSVFDSLARLKLMGLIEQDHKIINKINKGRPSTLFYLKYVSQGNKR